MFNNRMLAVAAVLVMAVPALGAATPIVVPPVPEQLVEGHTVFTVVEIVRATTTAEVRFAAAVAVLVREVQNVNVARRFPGVLWFNDQYLVNPTSSRNAEADFRYPCGGAVMAVNAGDPDPRMLIARLEGSAADGDEIHVGDANHTYAADEYWVKPSADKNGDTVVDDSDQNGDGLPDDTQYYYGEDSGGPGDAPTDYAWIGQKPGAAANVDPAGPAVGVSGAYSDTLLTQGIDYDESYLITDPNDHTWIIDKYNGYTRTDLSNVLAPTETAIYEFPVWVVNILGSPVFTTDQVDNVQEDNLQTRAGLPILGDTNCLPYLDIIPEEVQAALCDVSIPDPLLNSEVDGRRGDFGPDAEDEINVPQNFGTGQPFVDDPCKGYAEPSNNVGADYCYGGQPAADDNGDTVIDAADCEFMRADGEASAKPFRYYNAVLYFRFEDLAVAGADKIDHHLSSDTNGCSEEQYWWGPNPPMAADQYPCPGDDDNAEGNSHPFHPTPPPTHEDVQTCPPEFDGPNPTNHGGSTYVGGMPADGDGYYQTAAPCDWSHATRNIDIYFSGGGRPAPPVVPNFWLIDLEGSSAPFNGPDGFADHP